MSVKADGQTHYKVGFTIDSTQRLRSLQTACPLEIELEALFEHPKANLVERAAHEELDEHRGSGEWFLVPLGVIKGAVERAIDQVKD